ncbi:hypothetical protein ACIOAU_15730 [Pseudomonas sp. NPDC088322]|uniref:hypothetical protein n=1 Tax=Pseudomonas sp. NPDC088322 TaxID=3364452 RepID=UPI0038105DB2
MSESIQAQLFAIETNLSGLRAELSMGRVAAARATTALTARVASADVHVKPEEAVEPLRMGKVVFYGESARQIRAAQAVLQSAEIGQLEVVKRANEPGEPFVVIDGQVFINKATVDQGLVDPVRIEIKTTTTDAGQKVMSGLISESAICDQLLSCIEAIGAGDSRAELLRQVIRDELKPGGMLHRVVV